MSFEVTVSFVEQYKGTIEQLAQQKRSRFAMSVTMGSYVGDGAKAVDQIGEVTAQRKTSRHQDMPLISTPHSARWVHPEDFIWADLIDSEDKLRQITDFESPYAINGAASLERWKDDVIVAAFFADSKTGQKGTGTTSFPSGNIIPVGTGASAATGMNTAKIKRLKRLLKAAEVDLDFDPIYIGVSAIQDEELMGEYEVKSVEFANMKPVIDENGNLRRFLGCNFIPTERLDTDSSGYRRCPGYVKTGMHMGMWNDITPDIGPRRDKAGVPTQVSLTGTFGATRVQEVKVYDIPCSEA